MPQLALALTWAIYGGTGLALSTAAALAAATISFAGTAALAGLSFVAKKVLAKKPDISVGGGGSLLDASTDASPSRRVIYGECHVGGIRSFIATGENPVEIGDTIQNEMLYTVWTFAGHAVRQFKGIFLGDYPIWRTQMVKADGTNVGGTYSNANLNKDTPLLDGLWTTIVGRYAQRVKDMTGIPAATATGNEVVRWAVPVAVDFSLGDEADNVQPFPYLVTQASSSWLPTSYQARCAKLFMQFMYNRTPFPNGLPNVSAIVRGKECKDPRDDPDFDLVTAEYTRNPAVIALDYLLMPVDEGGFGATEAEIDFDSCEAAANICDETIAINSQTHSGYYSVVVEQDSETSLYPRVITQDPPDLTRALGRCRNTVLCSKTNTPIRMSSGDMVRVGAISGALPTGLSAGTDYYIAVLEPWPAPAERKRLTHTAYTTYGQPVDYNEDGYLDATGIDRTEDAYFLPRLAFHTSYEDAVDEDPTTRVAITAIGTGQMLIYKTGEPRYTCDMSFTVDRPRREVLEEIAGSMAGKIIFSGGKWIFKAGAYETPTVALDEDDCAGPLSVQTKRSMRERFNAVTGKFTLHFETKGEFVNYPVVSSSTALAEDGDEEVTAELNLPATTRINMAQRIAQIELLKSRQQITFEQDFNFKAYQLRAGSFFTYSNTRLGWSSKIFECIKWERRVEEEKGVARIVFRISAQESAEAVYEADPSLLDADDLSPNTNLPSAFVVQPPRNLAIEELQRNPSGQIVEWVARLTWDEPSDGFFERYEIQWRSEDDDDYEESGLGVIQQERALEILNLEAEKIWYFRVRSRNHLGLTSDWIEVSAEILGLTAPPSTPTGFQVVSMGSYAQATWDQSVDLDVRLGGACMLRIDEGALSDTPDWTHSVTIGFTDGIDGSATSTALPLKTGWYCLKFIDVLGNESTGAAFAYCSQTSPITYTNEIDAAFETAFAGDKYDVEVDGSNNLELSTPTATLVEPEGVYYPDMGAYSGLFDAHAGNFDDGGMFDGSYAYISGGGTRRVTSNIDGVVISGLDTDFDGHAGLFDDGGDFDGAQGADADIWMECSTSQDADPGDPSSTWSDWFRVDSSIISYTGLVPRFQYRSYQGNTQIDAATLGIVIDTPA